MKYVVNNTYHLWAHQTQEHARSKTGNESFRGLNAFSYRACIGTIVTNRTGKRAFYVNTRSYSITTTGHQCSLRCAIPATETVFAFDFPRDPYYHSTHAPGDHKAVFELLKEDVAKTLLKAGKARTNKARLLESALDQRENLLRFAAFWGIRRVIPSLEGIQEQAEKARAASVVMDAKREAATRVRHAKAEAQFQLDFPAKLELWRRSALLARFKTAFGYQLDYLRVSKDGKTVQTSRGADVPVEHVLHALPVVLRILRREDPTFVPNGLTIRLGYYTVSGIDATGVLTVGCHRFAREEVELMARTLGVSE